MEWTNIRHAEEELTWIGDTVSVPRHVVVQSEQHHPHGQGEHTSQETVEDQVEEQDEGCTKIQEHNKAEEKNRGVEHQPRSLI